MKHWELENLIAIPIHKQGETHDPKSHWPVSILPIISKVHEHHIYDKLSSILVFSDQQWRFLVGRITTGAIQVQEWHSHLNGAAEIQAIFFDLQKAFDTVPHVKLISKLSSLDIPSHLVAWISNYLYSR